MANKLFKHLGFTSKKVSNQPSPSHEYSSTKNSGSFQELLSNSPTKNCSVVVDSTSSISSCAARPEFDGRRHSDAATVRSSLPGRGRNKSTPPGATNDWSLSRGARPKDQRYASCRVPAAATRNEPVVGQSQTRSRRQPPQTGVTSQTDSSVKSPLHGADIRSPQNVSTASSANGLSTRICEEYSDPFDLKKVIEQNENASETVLSALTDDDVPHDSITDQDQLLKCEDDYSVPYELKGRLRDHSQVTDPRPSLEYDEPWDQRVEDVQRNLISAKTAKEEARVQREGGFQSQLVSGSVRLVPDSIRQRTVVADPRNIPSLSKREDEMEVSITEAITVPKYDDPYAEGPMLSSFTPINNGSQEPNNRAIIDDPCEVIPIEDSSPRCLEMTHVSGCGDKIIQSSIIDSDGGATYDEPWDLRAARIGLENRLRAVHSSPDQLASINCLDHSQLTDPRPSLEYDEPWDRRVKDVQRNLISAKTAKEEARVQREGGFQSQLVSGSVRLVPDSIRQRTVVADPRNIPSLSKRGVDPCCWSYRSAAMTGQMPKHKCVQEARDLPTLYRPVAERIDPKIPLQQQGWYHGSISRVDAETLLRIHREGSYLVRMSESNRIDYSLSFKSGRGFMHMKIVSTNSGGDSDVDRHYILGQFSQPFDSIPQMIHHYTINKLPIKGAEHMSLLHPVNNELL